MPVFALGDRIPTIVGAVCRCKTALSSTPLMHIRRGFSDQCVIGHIAHLEGCTVENGG